MYELLQTPNITKKTNGEFKKVTYIYKIVVVTNGKKSECFKMFKGFRQDSFFF
jgi:hypothetical protein